VTAAYNLSNKKRDMRFGTWNVRSLYRADLLTAAARELATYTSDLMGVQEVRWNKGATVRAGDYYFFYGKGNKNHQLGTGFTVHHRTVSAFARAEFVSNRVSYTVLRDHWFNTIFPNVYRNVDRNFQASHSENTDAKRQQLCSHFLLGIPFVTVLWVLNRWSCN
jgi:exonuclease III